MERLLRFLLLVLLVSSCRKTNYSIPLVDDWSKAEVLETKTIYEQQYSSFTDLIFYEGKYYITFRQAKSHAGTNDFGKIVVLESYDFVNWIVFGEFLENSMDLRDPKFIVYKNELMISVHGTSTNLATKSRYNYKLAVDLSGKIKLVSRMLVDNWPWSFTYSAKGDKWFAFEYSTSGNKFNLVSTSNFESILHECDFSTVKSVPSEARLVFNGSRCYALVRRNGTSLFGISNDLSSCYFEWQELDIRGLGGPNFLIYKNKYVLISGRDFFAGSVYTEQNRTSLFYLDLETRELFRIAILPSGGDTSYGGMHLEGNILFMSYYTTKSSRAVINTAQIKLKF